MKSPTQHGTTRSNFLSGRFKREHTSRLLCGFIEKAQHLLTSQLVFIGLKNEEVEVLMRKS